MQQRFSRLLKAIAVAALLLGSMMSRPTEAQEPPAPFEARFVDQQAPQADGSLIHTVQAGDTIDGIAVAYGLTRDQLLALNPLANPRIIQIGQELVIRPAPGAESSDEESTDAASASAETAANAESGEAAPEENASDAARRDSNEPTSYDASNDEIARLIEQAAPAPIRSASSGDVLPAINPAASAARVCVILFHDLNQNRIREANETLLDGGRVTLNASGAAVSAYDTDGVTDPYCFDDLSAGNYVAIADAPEGYSLTTPEQLRIHAVPGAVVSIAFGAWEGIASITPVAPETHQLLNEITAPETNPRAANLLLDNLGLIAFGLAGIVLVGGLGVSLLLRRR
jgi:LysM repeat protein